MELLTPPEYLYRRLIGLLVNTVFNAECKMFLWTYVFLADSCRYTALS